MLFTFDFKDLAALFFCYYMQLTVKIKTLLCVFRQMN